MLCNDLLRQQLGSLCEETAAVQTSSLRRHAPVMVAYVTARQTIDAETRDSVWLSQVHVFLDVIEPLEFESFTA